MSDPPTFNPTATIIPFRTPQKHLIPGLNHPLTQTTFITATQYNGLPSLPNQPPIPQSVLRRFGEIVVAYNLQQVIGAHLIYNRFHPGGIAEGSFVTTTKVPLNTAIRAGSVSGGIGIKKDTEAGAYNPSMTYTNPGVQGPTVKKMVWQSGIWELGIDMLHGSVINVDVSLVHGRLYLLSRSPRSRDYPSPQEIMQQEVVIVETPHQSDIEWPQWPHLQRPQHLHLTLPSKPTPTALGNTHHFLAYEYEYGPPPTFACSVPDAFWEDAADFIVENGLESRLALEVLDGPDVVTGRTGVGRFVVEEFDPTRSRKSSVVEVPAGKELSWSFSTLMNDSLGPSTIVNRNKGEVEVDVNLVRVGAGMT